MYQLQIGAEANIPVAFARYTLSFSISVQYGQVQVTVEISLFVHSSNIFYCYGFLHWKSLTRKLSRGQKPGSISSNDPGCKFHRNNVCIQVLKFLYFYVYQSEVLLLVLVFKQLLARHNEWNEDSITEEDRDC